MRQSPICCERVRERSLRCTSIRLRAQPFGLRKGYMTGAQYKVRAQPISLHKVIRSGAQYQVGARTEENGNALGKIVCRAPFGNGCKFQESCVSQERWVPSGQEYIPKGPTNMENHPFLMMIPLREVYKQRPIVRGRGLAIFGGETHKRKESNDQKGGQLSTTSLEPSWEAHTQDNRIQIRPKAPSLESLGWFQEVFPLQKIPNP